MTMYYFYKKYTLSLVSSNSIYTDAEVTEVIDMLLILSFQQGDTNSVEQIKDRSVKIKEVNVRMS